MLLYSISFCLLLNSNFRISVTVMEMGIKRCFAHVHGGGDCVCVGTKTLQTPNVFVVNGTEHSTLKCSQIFLELLEIRVRQAYHNKLNMYVARVRM